MSLFSKITGFLSGGLGKTIVDKVASQFPDKMSESEKAAVEKAIIDAAHAHELELLEKAQQDQESFNLRIRDMEGTTKDLQQFGIIGKIIVFLRGLQRPLWGFGVLYLDFMVFSGKWDLSQIGSQAPEINSTLPNAMQESLIVNLESAFWVINFLVLGFLFGERAMRNVMPLIRRSQGQSQSRDE